VARLEAAEKLEFDYLEMKEIQLLFSQNTGDSGTGKHAEFPI
jgi:hypothetical protein